MQTDDSWGDGQGRPSRACFAYGTSLVVLVATTLLLASLTLALGGRVGFWHLVGGLVAGGTLFACAAPTAGARIRTRLGFGLIWLAVVAAAVWVASAVRDVSFDGQNYHLEGVLTLASGWNPLRSPYPPPAEPGVDITSVTHYPKGAWMMAAALYRGVGRLEAGKALALLLGLSAAAFAAAVSLRLFASRRVALAMATVAAANPITIAQLSTFYVDGELGAVLTGLVCVLLWLGRERSPLGHLALGSLILIAASLKFTGLVYAAVIVSALLVLYVRRRNPPALGVAAVAFSLAVLAVNYQPYVFNTVRFGNPFHPVSTESTFGEQAASPFLARGRLAKLALSTFGRSGNTRHGAPSFKIPFSITPDELRTFAGFDVRTSGFGPLFGGAVLLAAVLIVLAWRADPSRARPATGLLVVLVASALAIPDPWWARLVPQLWLVPVVVAGLALGATMPARLRIAGGVLLALLAGNLALVAGVSGYTVLRRNQSLARQLAFLRDASREAPIGLSRTGAFRSVDVRLAEAGVSFVRAPEGTCPEPIPLDQTYERVQLCLEKAARARYRDELGE